MYSLFHNSSDLSATWYTLEYQSLFITLLLALEQHAPKIGTELGTGMICQQQQQRQRWRRRQVQCHQGNVHVCHHSAQSTKAALQGHLEV